MCAFLRLHSPSLPCAWQWQLEYDEYQERNRALMHRRSVQMDTLIADADELARFDPKAFADGDDEEEGLTSRIGKKVEVQCPCPASMRAQRLQLGNPLETLLSATGWQTGAGPSGTNTCAARVQVEEVLEPLRVLEPDDGDRRALTRKLTERLYLVIKAPSPPPPMCSVFGACSLVITPALPRRASGSLSCATSRLEHLWRHV